MEFRTELTPEQLPAKIQLTSNVVTIGSCFAEVMGSQLADYKLTVLSNPFGTLFNPVSITKLLLAAINGKSPDPDLYVERDGLWFHYDFHSSLWAHSRDELDQLLQERLTQTAAALHQADWLVLTLGTAVVYRHQETNKVVANCHKMPGKLFDKYLYGYEHSLELLTNLLRTLKRFNPSLKVLLTVSPVRHTKDTLPMNQASKSLLRMISHELTVWHEQVHYFPSYEIMVDDLRDYRFYEADLIHPNAIAQQYIFEKFADCVFDAELRAFINEWDGIRRALAHRPFHAGSESHQQFLQNLLKKLDRLSPKINVEKEREEVQKQVSALTSIGSNAN